MKRSWGRLGPLTTYKLAKGKGRGGRGNTNKQKEKKFNQIVKIF